MPSIYHTLHIRNSVIVKPSAHVFLDIVEYIIKFSALTSGSKFTQLVFGFLLRL